LTPTSQNINCKKKYFCLIVAVEAVCIGIFIVACSSDNNNTVHQPKQYEESDIVHYRAKSFSIRYTADSLNMEYSFKNDLTFPVTLSPTLIAVFNGDSTQYVWGYTYDEMATELCLSSNGRKLAHTWAESARFPYPDTLEYQFVTVSPNDSATVRYSVPMDKSVYSMLTKSNQADISIALWRTKEIQHTLKMPAESLGRELSNIELDVRCCRVEVPEDIAIAVKTSQSIPHVVLSVNDVYDLQEQIRYRIRASGRVVNQK